MVAMAVAKRAMRLRPTPATLRSHNAMPNEKPAPKRANAKANSGSLSAPLPSPRKASTEPTASSRHCSV